MIIDGLGNPLKEGDTMTVSVGGELMVGQIAKIVAGDILLGTSLTKEGATAQKQQPYVLLNLVKPLLINEQGVVIGGLKVSVPSPQA